MAQVGCTIPWSFQMCHLGQTYHHTNKQKIHPLQSGLCGDNLDIREKCFRPITWQVLTTKPDQDMEQRKHTGQTYNNDIPNLKYNNSTVQQERKNTKETQDKMG